MVLDQSPLHAERPSASNEVLQVHRVKLLHTCHTASQPIVHPLGMNDMSGVMSNLPEGAGA